MSDAKQTEAKQVDSVITRGIRISKVTIKVLDLLSDLDHETDRKLAWEQVSRCLYPTDGAVNNAPVSVATPSFTEDAVPIK